MVSAFKQLVYFLEIIKIVMKFYVTQGLQEAVHIKKLAQNRLNRQYSFFCVICKYTHKMHTSIQDGKSGNADV